MTLRYLSVCSGIEAASVAWAPLGLTPVAFAEIEKFPSAVLAHRYPHVPNLGDMTKFKEWPDLAIDLLVGGTPCQSFSVAGLRAGLADPRGNLALVYLAIAERYRPQWIIWENVPGVLSSTSHDAPDPCPPPDPVDLGCDGQEMEVEDDYAAEELHAFNSFLAGLSELGYGWAYRVLDARYVRVDGFGRAVPQRRRRVFVVGYLGDWRRAAAVLFDAASLHGDPAPRREAGEGVARPFGAGSASSGGYRNDADTAENLVPLAFGGNDTRGPISVSTALNAHGGPNGRCDFETETFIAENVSPPVTSNYYGDHESREGLFVAHALRAEGFDASEDGTGRGTPIVPVVADTITAHWERSKGAKAGNQVGLVNPIIEKRPLAFDLRGREGGAQFEGPHETANIRAASGGSSRSYVAGMGHNNARWAVRRLTPRECERLQGFPDDYTLIPFGRGLARDGPRYRAIGNSMAVNVMRWIGWRVSLAHALARNPNKGRAAGEASREREGREGPAIVTNKPSLF